MSNIVRNVLAAIAAAALTAWQVAAVATGGAQLDQPARSAYHSEFTINAARKG